MERILVPLALTLGFNINIIQYQKYPLYSLFIYYQVKDTITWLIVSADAMFQLTESSGHPIRGPGNGGMDSRLEDGVKFEDSVSTVLVVFSVCQCNLNSTKMY
jgi:hypothetical protein